MEKMATIMKTPAWLLIALFFTPVISFANDQSMHARGNAEEVLLSQAVEAPVIGLASGRSAPIRDGFQFYPGHGSGRLGLNLIEVLRLL